MVSISESFQKSCYLGSRVANTQATPLYMPASPDLVSLAYMLQCGSFDCCTAQHTASKCTASTTSMATVAWLSARCCWCMSAQSLHAPVSSLNCVDSFSRHQAGLGALKLVKLNQQGTIDLKLHRYSPQVAWISASTALSGAVNAFGQGGPHMFQAQFKEAKLGSTASSINSRLTAQSFLIFLSDKVAKL